MELVKSGRILSLAALGKFHGAGNEARSGMAGTHIDLTDGSIERRIHHQGQGQSQRERTPEEEECAT